MESEQEPGARGGWLRPNSAMFDPIGTEPPPKVAHRQPTGEKLPKSLCFVLNLTPEIKAEWHIEDMQTNYFLFSPHKPSKLLGNTLPRMTPCAQQVCFSLALPFIHTKMILKSAHTPPNAVSVCARVDERARFPAGVGARENSAHGGHVTKTKNGDADG